MTADPRDQQEPSMEEILSSIRRIIADEEAEGGRSDDDEVDQLETGDDADPVEPENDAEEDVLELTKVVRASGQVVDLHVAEDDPAEEATGRRGDEDGQALMPGEDDTTPLAAHDAADAPADDDDHEPGAAIADDRYDEDDEFSVAPTAAHAVSVVEEDASQEDHTTVPKQAARDELLSDAAASAATGAFAKLSHAFQRTPVEESIADGDGRSIEQFVEDIIRPMLRDWLDEKLPPIVERLVEKEINKIARRAELM